MSLDLVTMYFMLCIVTSTMAICLLAANLGKRQDEVAKWSWLMLFSGIATALIMLRGLIPDMLSITVANGLLSAGYVYGYIAFCEFTNTAKNRWYCWGVPAITVVLNTIFLEDQVMRMILNSGIFGTQNLLISYLIFIGKNIKSFKTRWIAFCGTAVGCGSYFIRAAAAAVFPEKFATISSPTFFATATLLTISMTVIISSVGVLLLSRERSDAENLYHATNDYLTKTLNRRGFLQEANREIAKHNRSQKPLSLIMLDADNFKRINDIFGHLAGDKILKDLAELIRLQLRSYDILGRFGGEEFWIILPETNSQDAYGIAERVRQGVADCPMEFDHDKLRVTISCGLTTSVKIKESPIDLEEMIRQADNALYRAKAEGRNQTFRFEQQQAPVNS